MHNFYAFESRCVSLNVRFRDLQVLIFPLVVSKEFIPQSQSRSPPLFWSEGPWISLQRIGVVCLCTFFLSCWNSSEANWPYNLCLLHDCKHDLQWSRQSSSVIVLMAKPLPGPAGFTHKRPRPSGWKPLSCPFEPRRLDRGRCQVEPCLAWREIPVPQINLSEGPWLILGWRLQCPAGFCVGRACRELWGQGETFVFVFGAWLFYCLRVQLQLKEQDCPRWEDAGHGHSRRTVKLDFRKNFLWRHCGTFPRGTKGTSALNVFHSESLDPSEAGSSGWHRGSAGQRQIEERNDPLPGRGLKAPERRDERGFRHQKTYGPTPDKVRDWSEKITGVKAISHLGPSPTVRASCSSSSGLCRPGREREERKAAMVNRLLPLCLG